VAGLVAPSEAVFMALVVDTMALWLVATMRHVLAGSDSPGPVSHSPAAG